MGRNYWMISESQENFEITKSLGFTLHGLGPRHRRRADRMQPDDRMLYYVKGLRKWTASLIITSRSFEGRDPIWVSSRKGNGYPYRVQISPDIVLDAEDYIDALILAPRLEYIKRWAPEDWPLAFFDRLHLLPQRDFRLIEGEMKRNISQRRRSSKGRDPLRAPSPAGARGDSAERPGWRLTCEKRGSGEKGRTIPALPRRDRTRPWSKTLARGGRLLCGLRLQVEVFLEQLMEAVQELLWYLLGLRRRGELTELVEVGDVGEDRGHP